MFLNSCEAPVDSNGNGAIKDKIIIIIIIIIIVDLRLYGIVSNTGNGTHKFPTL